MIPGKTIVLTIQIFVSKGMSLLFNMLSRFVIVFLPRSKHVLISWPQSPSEEAILSIKIDGNPNKIFSEDFLILAAEMECFV